MINAQAVGNYNIVCYYILMSDSISTKRYIWIYPGLTYPRQLESSIGLVISKSYFSKITVKGFRILFTDYINLQINTNSL